ncbi:MAG: tetratricopeptide repeat protein, partial [Cyanobacteria bacterium J06636_28]
FNQAITLNEGFVDAYSNRAKVRTELGDYAGAMKDYCTALRLDPALPEIYPRTLPQLQNVLQDCPAPGKFALLNNRGNARAALGDSEGALDDYTEALRISPKAYVYHNRALVQLYSHRYEMAAADFSEVIRLEPRCADAFSNRSSVRHHLGNLAGAMQDVNQAIALNPSLANAYAQRGRIQVDLHQYQAAMADFDQALSLQPDAAQTFNERSVLRFRLKDVEGALADVNRALELQPQFPDAYINRSLIRFDRGDRSGALSDIVLVMKLNQTA